MRQSAGIEIIRGGRVPFQNPRSGRVSVRPRETSTVPASIVNPSSNALVAGRYRCKRSDGSRTTCEFRGFNALIAGRYRCNTGPVKIGVAADQFQCPHCGLVPSKLQIFFYKDEMTTEFQCPRSGPIAVRLALYLRCHLLAIKFQCPRGGPIAVRPDADIRSGGQDDVSMPSERADRGSLSAPVRRGDGSLPVSMPSERADRSAPRGWTQSTLNMTYGFQCPRSGPIAVRSSRPRRSDSRSSCFKALRAGRSRCASTFHNTLPHRPLQAQNAEMYRDR